MINYGSYTGGSLRRAIRSEVALQYPSVVQYRRILTPFQEEQAKAGQFHFGNPNANQSNSWWDAHKNNPGIYIPVIIGLVMWLKR